ncbi:MAG TPA: ATP-binding protein [Streptosporangiaceae bacterium]|nr:ATP-binding protein [Streptosporangiaceae bacterium]
MRTRVLHSQGPAKDVRFCLVFPRESLSIPVMRRVLGDTLNRLGVDESSVSDLLLAVTEACTNVLRHAGPGCKYEVVVKVGRNRCVLQVLDNGRGIDAGRLGITRRTHLRRPPVRPVPLRSRRAAAQVTDVQQLPESGRGLAIMRACVDDVSLRSGPGQGTVVQLRKRIELRDDAPLANLGNWALKDAG